MGNFETAASRAVTQLE